MSISHLDVRDDLRELAERYETVAALEESPDERAGHTPPGSRVPPGMQAVLDADEIGRALGLVDEWAEFVHHVAVDECDAKAASMTPAKLRVVGEHAAHFVDHEDELFALSFLDDLHDRLRDMRRLSNRGVRRVRTGERCQDTSCRGHLISPLGGADRHDDALECDRCHVRVPYSVWSSWPRARVQYVTVEHAANLRQTTVAAVKQMASRKHWRRVGTGRDVRYLVDDVRAEA